MIVLFVTLTYNVLAVKVYPVIMNATRWPNNRYIAERHLVSAETEVMPNPLDGKELLFIAVTHFVSFDLMINND